MTLREARIWSKLFCGASGGMSVKVSVGLRQHRAACVEAVSGRAGLDGARAAVRGWATHPRSISHARCEISPESIQVLRHVLGRGGKASGKVRVGATLDGRVEGLGEDVL